MQQQQWLSKYKTVFGYLHGIDLSFYIPKDALILDSFFLFQKLGDLFKKNVKIK